MTQSPRAWQRMLSGRRLDLLDPSPVDIEIEDIAHGLARVARWNGQTTGDYAFSVAQHSLIVEDFMGRMFPKTPLHWRMAALLHDAPEYVIGDMISPFKSAIGSNYRDLEHRLQKAIHIRFSLPPDIPNTIEKQIKRADRASAYFEAIQLAGFSVTEANKFWRKPKAIPRFKIEVDEPEIAKEKFLNQFHKLQKRIELETLNT